MYPILLCLILASDVEVLALPLLVENNIMTNLHDNKRQEPVLAQGTYLDTWAVVGIIVGVIVTLLLVGLLIVLGRRGFGSRRR